ncbi:MAG: macro domain-containing protein [Lachnospiraceae bacterium]|nr:macro domain-containing protein [Lachnospiraceae bacterium]
MPFKIVRNDITKMNTEAIVNTANKYSVVGAGCDTAIYNAAGYEELLEYRVKHFGSVPEGEVFLTPGFRLPAKYIIHAVSPLFVDGTKGEEEKLRSCYRQSLQLAKEKGIRSIAFPLIATGSFGYPKEEGMRIAVDEINAFLLSNDMDVYLVVFGDGDKALGQKLYPDLEEYIDRTYVTEKVQEEYFGKNSARSDRAYGEALASETVKPVSGRLRNAFPTLGAVFQREKKTASAPLKEELRTEASVPEPSVSEPTEDAEESIDFADEHESKLNERMRHLSDTFSEYLLYLIREKQMENAEVYKRAIVDKKIFSKIKNNPDYHPQKLTALCLCVGAKLNLDESKDLLARAGYALSPCDKTDIIFSYFIENEIYDMIELDIQLEEHGLPCIIS